VDALYDTALLSWSNALQPPLPSYSTPAAESGLPTFEEPSFRALFDEKENPLIQESGDARASTQVIVDGNSNDLSEHISGDPHYDPDIAAEIRRMRSVLSPRRSENRIDAVTRHLSMTIRRLHCEIQF